MKGRWVAAWGKQMLWATALWEETASVEEPSEDLYDPHACSKELTEEPCLPRRDEPPPGSGCHASWPRSQASHCRPWTCHASLILDLNIAAGGEGLSVI